MRASPDDILGMAFFARVVEARSFSDAARSLGVSKSAVSARVARLEKHLGVRLLHRTTRRLALTADGVRLYERCARVIAEADAAAEIAAGASAVPRGTLRVYAPAGFGQTHLTRPIGDFMRMHEGIRIDLRLSERIPDLTVDEVDVAIVVAGRLADSGLTTRKLASTRVVVCAAPEYLRRKGIPFRPQDLVLHDCLSHSIRQTVEDWRFHTDEGAVSMAALSNLMVDDARFLRQAAVDGLGLAMLPEFLVADELASGRLRVVLDDFQTLELGIHTLHAHGRLPPASVRAFIDHLAACFRAPPWEKRVRPPAPAPSKKPRRERAIPMTEQDVRRLSAVAALYADVDPAAAARLLERVGAAKVTRASKVPRTSVTMNSRLRVSEDGEKERELSLVYPWEAGGDRISVMSALGLALLGADAGSRITAGGRRVTVTSIPYQPEAAGDAHL